MGRRRLLCALIALAFVFCPFASGARAKVDATGVIAGAGTSYTLTITNTGDEPIRCWGLGVPTSVTVTGVQGPAGWNVNVVGTGISGVQFPGPGIAPGGSATFSFTTTAPYPAGVASSLVVSATCQAGSYVDAPVTGPPPCRCLTLNARILPNSLKITNPGEVGIMHLEFAVHWTLNCTTGAGGCKGTLDLVAPKRATTDKKKPDGYKSYFKDPKTKRKGGTHVACVGACAELTEGTQHFVLIGDRGLGRDRRAVRVKSIPIVIKRTCQGKTTRPITLTLVFRKDTRLIDKKKSKLK